MLKSILKNGDNVFILRIRLVKCFCLHQIINKEWLIRKLLSFYQKLLSTNAEVSYCHTLRPVSVFLWDTTKISSLDKFLEDAHE